jgi:CRISPR/Cas system-associated endonuclease/helicase Cas3
MLSMLAAPAATIDASGGEAKDLEKIMIINALDLMYFWMYQPRAQHILQDRLKKLSVEERKILLHSQFILRRRQDIEQMFHDGLIGRNYELALAFYEDRHQEYLSAMEKMIND